MANTKQLAWHSANSTTPTADPAVEYQFRLRGHSRSVGLRTYAGDLTIFYDIWWRKIYDLPESLVHSSSTIIDLGAHVGMTSLYFSLQFPQATIYAVEADAHNYELLCKNLSPEIENGRLTPLLAAIHENNSPVYLQKSQFSYNTQVSSLPTAHPIPGLTLDQLIADHGLTRIDILKIDIEGAEAFLLQSSQQWLSITRHILIELHSEALVNRFIEMATLAGFRIEKRPFTYENLYWAYRG
ncbi:FkbM family methyltransferase [Paraflavitalea sp. CAU 1676]|uniref:FkbM family methyltransferase n=1 Tax=Paraflavitalea sp. CAU 1676 TaxID=3032598 RepID=UPI0023DADB21|nr:FkbM family methyltransferase [Paraflavitalea sp. CAU 1676]MDF2190018.1 FkbM family methyltransferase [Paraflavitalea sp. CAU 1676]